MASTEKLIRITLRLQDQMSQQLDRATNKLQNLGQGMTRLGQTMTTGITAPVVAMGAAVFKTFADFEGVMVELQARTQSTAEEMAMMEEMAISMGRETVFSATEAAEAMLELTSSGSSAAEAMEQLPAVLDLAAAGALDLGEAADGVTDVLAMFQLEASDAADVVDALARASGSSSATVADLTQAFGNVGPVASQFGLSVEETAAALAVFAENGIKGAEAGTNLRSMLLNMTRETEAVHEAWSDLGVSLYDSTGQMRNIDTVFQEIAAAMEDMSMEDQIRISRDLAGSYGLIGFNALTAAGGIGDMSSAMDGAASASEVAQARMNTLQGRWNSFMGSLETLAIVLGGLGEGPLTDFILMATNIVNAVATWAEENPKLAQSIMLVVVALAALGPVLMVLGSIVSAVGSLAGAWGAVTGAVAAAMPVIMGLLGAIGTAVSFVISTAIPAIVSGIATLGGAIIGAITPIITAIVAGIYSILVAIGTALVTAITTATTAIVGFATAMWAAIAPVVVAALPIIALIAAIAALAIALDFWRRSNTTQVWRNNFDMLGTIVERGTQRIGRTLQDSGRTWGQNFENFGTILERLREKFVQFVARVVPQLVQSFRNILPAMQELGTNIMQGLINGIRNKIAEFIDMIRNTAEGAVNAIRNAFQISSPSKVMEGMGQNIIAGWEQGIGGGLQIPTPSTTSGRVPTVGGSPSFAGAGGGNVNINTVNVPPGTTREQVETVMREIGKASKRRGASSI